jgi:hypothetical protein
MANNGEHGDGRENTNHGVTLEREILRAGCAAWMALAVEHHRHSDKSFLVPSSGWGSKRYTAEGISPCLTL